MSITVTVTMMRDEARQDKVIRKGKERGEGKEEEAEKRVYDY